MYKTDIQDLIKERHSTRAYSDQAISDDTWEELLTYAKTFDNQYYRFDMIRYELEEGRKLATYGFIKNAKNFIAGIGLKTISHDNEIAIQFGYDFEHIILKATDLGLSTCWMAMSYNVEQINKALQVTSSEQVVMLSPLGFSAKETVFQRFTRKAIKADQRKPFNELFYRNDFDHPITDQEVGHYELPLQLLRLGPSAGNAQPWRVILTKGQLDFYVRPKKMYKDRKDQRIDLSYNDMGIAKYHFELGAEIQNIEGSFMVDDDLINLEGYSYSYVLDKH